MLELTNVVKKKFYLYTFLKYGHFLRHVLQFSLQNDINLCIKELKNYVESDEIRGSFKKKSSKKEQVHFIDKKIHVHL